MKATIEALSTLASSVLQWNTRLDELNGQIALRQIELARLEERPPTARSVRKKGSTESLRPKDGDENPFLSNDPDALASNEPSQSQRQKQNGFPPAHRLSSSTAKAGAVTTPPPPKANSNPRPSPNALTRQSSQPTPPAHVRSGPVLRQRKAESLASGESLVPRRKTRSMIIVYYDSAVQTAFEDLVKFVSGSRNALRKGRMALKMAEMKRVAELEVEGSDEDGSDAEEIIVSGNLAAAHRKLKVGREASGGTPPVDGKPEADLSIQYLRFVSTREMGRAAIKPRILNSGSQLGFGLWKSYRRGGEAGGPDIFDELDKALEWCQSECERAAHQFLRDGECGTEIDNIKKKLLEVKLGAEQEGEKLKNLEADPAPVRGRETPLEARGSGCRGMKPIQMRRDLGAMKNIEVDDSTNMEVDDDEGVDDLEPPKLLFKRTRDI